MARCLIALGAGQKPPDQLPPAYSHPLCQYHLPAALAGVHPVAQLTALMAKSQAAACAVELPVVDQPAAPSRKSASNFLRVSAIAPRFKTMSPRYEGSPLPNRSHHAMWMWFGLARGIELPF